MLRWIVVVVLLLAPRVATAGYVVTTTADTTDLLGDCSLREAFTAVNGTILTGCTDDANAAYDILLPAGAFNLGSAITTTIPAALHLTGHGADTIVTAASADRVMQLSPSGASSALTIDNMVLSGNGTVATGSGGAVLTLLGDVRLTTAALTLKSGDIAGAGAAVLPGGCLYTEGTTLTLTGQTSFTLCHADGNGGAIYAASLTGNNALVTTGVSFTDNSAQGFGGALYATAAGAATLNFSGSASVFDSNDAVLDGGAAFLSGFTDVSIGSTTFSNNEAANGGALYTSAVQTSIESSAAFHSNAATEHGGAIALASNRSLAVHGATLANNVATSPSGGFGGAIFVDSGGTLVVDSASNIGPGNAAAGAGGAIYCSGATVTLQQATFNANGAYPSSGAPSLSTNLGGAVAIAAPCAATINDVVFSNNVATNGGALYVDSPPAKQTINHIVFDANRAGRGGAIDNHSAVAVERSTLTNNQATTTHGGAIFNGIETTNAASLVVLHSTLSSNSAVGEGGAIANYGYARLNNLTVVENTAGQAGGIVVRSPRAPLEYDFLVNSIVSRNVDTAPPLAHDLFVADAAEIDVHTSLISRLDNSGLSASDVADCIVGSIAAPLNDGLLAAAQNGDVSLHRTCALRGDSPAQKLGGSVIGFACGARHAHPEAHASPGDTWSATISAIDQRGVPRPAGPAGTLFATLAPTTGASYGCDAGAFEAPRAALTHTASWLSTSVPATPGEAATLVVSLSNEASPSGWINLPPSAANAIAHLTATPPGFLAAQSWSCTYAGGAAGAAASVATLDLVPTTLPPGGSVTCQISDVVPPDARGGPSATVGHTIDATAGILDGGSTTALTPALPLTPRHDLALSLSENVATRPRFDKWVVSGTFRNDGPSQAKQVRWTITANPALVFAPTDSSPDCSVVGATIVCGVFDLPSGATTTRQVALRVSANAPASSTIAFALASAEATVAPGGAPIDPEPPTPSADPSTASATLNVSAPAPADLALTVNASPTELAAGEELDYIFTTRNLGPGFAAEFRSIAVVGTAATVLRGDSTLPSQCDIVPTPAGSIGPFTVTCFCSDDCGLGPDDALTATIATTVAPSTPASTLVNGPQVAHIEASSAAKPSDPTTTNDVVDSLSVTVTTRADLQVTATLAGDGTGRVVLTCDTRNVGPSNAEQAVFSVDIPSGTTLRDAATPEGWQCATPAVGSGGTVQCLLTALAPTTDTPLSFVIGLNGPMRGSIDARCEITSRTLDPEGLNNSATAHYEVPQPMTPDNHDAVSLRGGLGGRGCRCGESGAPDGSFALLALLWVSRAFRRSGRAGQTKSRE